MEFMNSIKKYDADVPPESDTNSEMSTSVMDTSKDTMAELFQDEAETGGGGASPTPPTQYASQANAGYEIPARLRTLHNLVIQ